MQANLFQTIEKNNFITRLSGVTKLITFLALTFGIMFSFDLRYILAVFLLSLIVFFFSGIPYRKVRTMLIYVTVYVLLNTVLTYFFSPRYGNAIFGTEHVIFEWNRYLVLTQEEVFYLIVKTMKYFAVVPFGIVFFFTTQPSEFASSLNRVGVSYKAAYAFALTLRYFPDMVRQYRDISMAQQSRGLDLSRKEKMGKRIRNTMSILVPLILTTLNRIEAITNSMDLRSFGKNKKRTWYAARPLHTSDWLCMALCGMIFLISIVLIFWVNHSRYWNPFIL